MKDFLMYFFGMIPRIIFQPQYGVPVAGFCYFEEQLLQSVLVWVMMGQKARLMEYLVFLVILAVVDIVFFRGRDLLFIFLNAANAVLRFNARYVAACWCLMAITVIFTLQTVYGIWTAENHRGRSVHARIGASFYRLTYRWLGVIPMLNANDAIRVNTARILVTVCCLFGVWRVPVDLQLFGG